VAAPEPLRRVVADTSVLAALLFGPEQQRAEVEALFGRVSQVHAPAFWQAEFLSVLWKVVRSGQLESASALLVLERALHLPVKRRAVFALWKDALELAIEADHSPYDTLFVALARRLGTILVTYDGKLLERFPVDARHPAGLDRLGRV
jgi:predicted nucleic acid-binding protein